MREEREEDTVERAVDKEVEDLVFIHRSQQGRRINMEELRREVAQLKEEGKSKARRKAGEIMGEYYARMKREEKVEEELGETTVTEGETREAIRELRPRCPLRMGQLMEREGGQGVGRLQKKRERKVEKERKYGDRGKISESYITSGTPSIVNVRSILETKLHAS